MGHSVGGAHLAWHAAACLPAWSADPACARRAGMWNIAHNMGGFLAPILAGTAAKVRRQRGGCSGTALWQAWDSSV